MSKDVAVQVRAGAPTEVVKAFRSLGSDSPDNILGSRTKPQPKSKIEAAFADKSNLNLE